jgi:hypothetical protein
VRVVVERADTIAATAGSIISILALAALLALLALRMITPAGISRARLGRP